MSSSFRCQLLSLSLLVSIAASWAAFAQAPVGSVGSGLTGGRVTRLERISNARSQLLARLQQQLSSNQSDVDSLCGQTQESQYQLNQVVKRQKQILLQVDSPNSGDAAAQSTSSDQSGAAASATPTANAGTVSAGAPMKGGDANTDCSAAIALVQDKPHQDDTVVASQNFIKSYPDSTYLPDANYWLGQLSCNKDKKDNAAYYFASVVKNYPKSPRAADAMFKVGVIIQDKSDTTKARAVYQQVISKYPGTDGARQTQKRPNVMQCITYDQRSHCFWSCHTDHKRLSDLHRNFCCAQA